MEAMPREKPASEMFNDGDWRSAPWFLEPEHEGLFNHYGIPLDLREQATAGLERAFPPAVCREMLDRGFDGGIILGLFRHFPLSIFPLLQLGLNIEVLGADADEPLLHRLRFRKSFHSTQFEIAVWANLKRAGHRFAREPKGPGKKRPDFEVFLNGTRYVLELKALQRLELDDLAAEADWVFNQHCPSLMVSGRLVTIRPSQDYFEKGRTASGRIAIRGSLEEIAKAFAERAHALQQAGVPLGDHPVPPYGSILVESADFRRGAMQCLFVPELSLWEQTKRLIRDVEEKGKQLPNDAAGILLFDVGRMEGVERLRLSLRAKAHERPSLFKHCKLIILAGTLSTTPEKREQQPFAVLSMPGHKLTPSEVELARMLTRNTVGDWLRPPERRLLSTFGSASLGPNQTVTVRFNANDINTDVEITVKDNDEAKS